MLHVRQLPVLQDNFIYLVRDRAQNAVAVVDPAVAEPVLEAAQRLGWAITHILNTHHHGDHVGGNIAIKTATGCTIVGPALGGYLYAATPWLTRKSLIELARRPPRARLYSRVPRSSALPSIRTFTLG